MEQDDGGPVTHILIGDPHTVEGIESVHSAASSKISYMGDCSQSGLFRRVIE
jgi:hypothetical protein